jgi:hypothetical protein
MSTAAKPKADPPARARRKTPPKATVLPAKGTGRRRLKAVETAPEPVLFDLTVALDDMPENFLQCRDYLHAWKPYGARQNPDRTFTSTLRCNRCTTLKNRTINRHGHVLSVTYDYPEGYTIAGSGRLDGDARDMIRLRSIMRQINVDTAEDAHA